MAGQIQKCHDWAEQTVSHIKSSPVIQKAVDSPKLAVYGAAFLVLISWLLVRVTHHLTKAPERSRPSTPDLEKPASGRSFKAPPRKAGGLLCLPNRVADC